MACIRRRAQVDIKVVAWVGGKLGIKMWRFSDHYSVRVFCDLLSDDEMDLYRTARSERCMSNLKVIVSTALERWLSCAFRAISEAWGVHPHSYTAFSYREEFLDGVRRDYVRVQHVGRREERDKFCTMPSGKAPRPTTVHITLGSMLPPDIGTKANT